MEWCALYASQKLLDSLPADLSKVIMDKANSVMTVWGSKLCEDKAEDFRQQLLKGGMQEININVSEFSQKLRPVYMGFFKDRWISSFEEIQSYAK